MRCPSSPAEVVFDRRSAWVLLPTEQRVAQVDLERPAVLRSVKLPFPAGGIALGDGALYVTEQGGGPGVVRVSTSTAKITARWTVPARGIRSSDPSGIAAGAGSVWLARGAEVVRVDARSGRVQHRFALPVTATLLQFAGGDLWAASSENGVVEKIDPAANRIVARATLHGWLSAMTVTGGSVWVTAVPDDVVFRLDADDASVQELDAGGGRCREPGGRAGSGLRRRLERACAGPPRRRIGQPNGHRAHREPAARALPRGNCSGPPRRRSRALPAAASGPEIHVAVAARI